ncbi:MAG TPA: HD domain-containing protein [Erysipelotrichaceae bacterium]|nr:HD domain-containing protein [Erysipelotrichaceae bacterium]
MNILSEEKVFRDPIHGYVRVQDKVIWNCIQTREFQRLRRVKQLGSTSMVYHTSEHSRFAHSLGVYEIIRRMINEVKDISSALTDYEKLTVKLAGLLHDVGHAPFSHSFEAIMDSDHELYTIQIILEESEVNTVLKEYETCLPADVASVINGTHPNRILCQMVSSQLDADRMDYLLRDSYFSGTKYGEFDLERVLRTMRVADDKLTIKASGMHTIEDYIMARYHMYWQVYYHPVSRSYDALLQKVFQRLFDLYQKDKSLAQKLPMFKALLKKQRFSNEELYLLDDATCFYGFNMMSQMDDEILADLAKRILSRNLFKYTTIDKKEEIQKKCLEKGYDSDYYLHQDYQSQNPYRPYTSKAQCIWVLDEEGSIRELSTVSTIVSSLCQNDSYEDEKIFFPKEIL